MKAIQFSGVYQCIHMLLLQCVTIWLIPLTANAEISFQGLQVTNNVEVASTTSKITFINISINGEIERYESSIYLNWIDEKLQSIQFIADKSDDGSTINSFSSEIQPIALFDTVNGEGPARRFSFEIGVSTTPVLRIAERRSENEIVEVMCNTLTSWSRELASFQNQISEQILREAGQLCISKITSFKILSNSIMAKSVQESIAIPISEAVNAPASKLENYTVGDIQSWLTQLGYNPGPIDGSYGRRTEEALKNFYNSIGASFDGVLDQNEIIDLRGQLSSSNVEVAESNLRTSIISERLLHNLDIHNIDSIPAAIRPSGPIPRWISGGQVVQSPSDKREEFVIDETFRVSRGKRIVIEDKIIRMVASGDQSKDIEIYGNLEIRNSVIIWEQKFNQQVRLIVKNGGNLQIYNSYGFASVHGWWNWDFESGSTIFLDRAFIDVWTTAAGRVNYSAQNFSQTRLTLIDSLRSSKVVVKDSIRTDLELFTPRGTRATFSVPPSREVVDWKVTTLYPSSLIELTNSKIGRIDVTVTNDSDITLVNYIDGQIGLSIDGGQNRRKTCSIDGFGDPRSMRGLRVESKTWEIDCNNSSVTFVNSNVVGFWFALWGNVELEVTRSRLIDITNAGCRSDLIIRESTVDLLRNDSRDWCGNYSARTFVVNSEIKQGVDASGERSNVWLYNTVVKSEGRNEALTARNGARITRTDSNSLPW